MTDVHLEQPAIEHGPHAVHYIVTPRTAWPTITAEQLTALDRLTHTLTGPWTVDVHLPQATLTAIPAHVIPEGATA